PPVSHPLPYTTLFRSDVDAAREPVRRVHGHRADTVVAQMLLHLCDERARVAAPPDLDLERAVHLRQLAREDRDSRTLVAEVQQQDRKSTRLNSSHVEI